MNVIPHGSLVVWCSASQPELEWAKDKLILRKVKVAPVKPFYLTALNSQNRADFRFKLLVQRVLHQQV